MQTGAITSYIDVAQVTLYVFFGFFAGLIFYLRREDKREGYPLESDRSENVTVRGFPNLPKPKAFHLPHGGTVYAPRFEAPSGAEVPYPYADGSGFEPEGNKLLSGLGPAAYAMRADTPDLTAIGALPRVVPLRVAHEYSTATEDPELIGMIVIGADGLVAGTVRDAWVDRSELVLRYLEVEVGTRFVLVPMPIVSIDARRGQIKVSEITAAQFADVPGLAHPDQVTLREEDRISAYFAGGSLYAMPGRAEPLL